MSQEIEKLAYQLWEQAGRPYCDDDRFWRQAEEQLALSESYNEIRPMEAEFSINQAEDRIAALQSIHAKDKTWKVSSGVLEVEGAGDLREMVDVFLKHADDENQQLGETVEATCGDERVTFDTIPNLQRLGLWN